MVEDTVRRLVENGRYQEALNIIDSQPIDPILHLLKIEVLRETGDYEHAWEQIEQIRQKTTSEEMDIILSVEEAYLLYRQKKLDQARQIVTRLQQKFGNLSSLTLQEARVAMVKSFSLAGNLCWRSNDFDGMYENYATALDLAQTYNHSYSMIHSLIGLGNHTKTQGEFLSAISYYENALYTSIAAGNLKFEAYCRNNLGEIYRLLGRIDEAIREFLQADNYFSSQLSFGPMTVTALNLAICYYIKEQDEIAMRCFNYGLQLAQEVGHGYELLDIFIIMLLIQERNENDSEMERIYQEFMDFFQESADQYYYLQKRLIEGMYLFSQKSIGSRAKAQEIFEELADAEAEFENMILVLTYLIEIKIDDFRLYKQQQVMDELRVYFHRYNNLKVTPPISRIRILLLQAKMEEFSGNLAEAMSCLNQATMISDKYGLRSQKYEVVEAIHDLQLMLDNKMSSNDLDEELIDSYLALLKRHLKS